MSGSFSRPRRSLFSRIAIDRRGATAIMVALGMTVLLGFAGTGIDIAFWETTKRNMQGAADQAAYSAVIAAGHGGSPTDNARGVTAQMGFVNSQAGVQVAVNNPPASGPNHTNSQAWEVIITKPQPLWFSRLFLTSTPLASARAVAIPSNGGSYCILMLGPGSNTIALQGNPALNTPNCDVQANSTDPAAVTAGGSASIRAHTLSMGGSPGYRLGGSAEIVAEKKSNAAPISDPYVNVLPPSAVTLLAMPCKDALAPINVGNHQNVTLQPGRYCHGINVQSGGQLTFQAGGVFYIDGGIGPGNGITSNGGTINGNGVNIILTTSGTNYPTISLGGNASVNLTAKSTGSYAGIVIYEDPRSPVTNANALGGGSNQTFTGALYFPSTPLTFGGNSTSSNCTQMIAYKLILSGDSSFNSQCGGLGTRAITGANTIVAE